MASIAPRADGAPRAGLGPPLRFIERPGLPLAVVAEMPHSHSAVIEVLVRSGSAYETVESNGTAHFLEHVLLAGSRRWPGRAELQRAIDSTGGFLDAFTHKEVTEFSFQVLPGEVGRAIEILGDALAHSSFSPEAVDSERQIVLEEMLTGNYEGASNPFAEVLWGTDSVGLPIIGRREVVERLTPADLRTFWARCFTPANLVVAVAGAVSGEEVERALESFRGLPQAGEVLRPPPAPVRDRPGFRAERFPSGSLGVCLMLRSPGLDGTDPGVHIALDLLVESFQTHVYQELIGPRLPVYYLHAGQETFLTEGYLYFSFNVSRERFLPTLDRVTQVIDRMRAEGVPKDELEVNKRMYALSILSNLDDPRDVASRLGMDHLLYGRERALDVEAELRRVEAVTPEEVRERMEDLFHAANLSVVAKGGMSWWTERKLRRRLERWLP